MFVKKKSLISVVLIFFTAVGAIVFNSTLGCRISVLILLVICIYKGKQERYYINPYIMFALVPFSLLIYANISNYMMDLSVSTWILAIINIAAYLIALEFTRDYKNVDKCIGAGKGSMLVQNTFIMLFLGFASTLFQMLFGLSMPLASIFDLFSTGAMVCAMKSKEKWLIGLVTGITIVSWVSYVSKTSVLTFCLVILICYEKYYLVTAKQKKRFVILMIVSIIVMIAAFSFANQDRDTASAKTVLEYYTTYGGLTWKGNEAFLMPYMYLTTPWANLQYVLETQNVRTYGLWFLKPFIGYFQIDSIFSDYYVLEAYSNFNTFTYIAYGFKDFGYWGSILSSFFLGFFSKKIYSRYVISKSPLDIACYVLLAQAVIEMFFSNHFYTQSYPFTIVIIMGVYKVVFCRKCVIEVEEN